jgi:hypothetical protein
VVGLPAVVVGAPGLAVPLAGGLDVPCADGAFTPASDSFALVAPVVGEPLVRCSEGLLQQQLDSQRADNPPMVAAQRPLLIENICSM